MAIVLSKFNIKLTVYGLQTVAGDLSSGRDELPFTKNYNFTSGETANKAELFWSDTRTLAATTADNIDLAGALTANLGADSTISFTSIKAIIIVHKTAGASAAARVGGHATLALPIFGSVEGLDTDQPYLILNPGGMLALVAPDAAGYPVGAGASDMLTIYNGGAASIDYDIIILGTV